MSNVDLSLTPTGTPPSDTQEVQIRDALGIDRALNVTDPTTGAGVAAAVGTQGYTTDSPPRHFKKFGTGATDWVQLPDQTDLDASLALKADQTDLDASLALKADHIELDVLDPSISGVAASISTIGTATDNTQWVKAGELDTDWRQFLTSEADGTYSANIELADVSDIIPPENVLGLVGGKLTVGDGTSIGGVKVDTVASPTDVLTHTLTQDEWIKAAKFTFTNETAISGSINTDSNFFRILRWDGQYSKVSTTPGGTGNSQTSFTVSKWDTDPTSDVGVISSPYNTKLPKFAAILPCDVSGSLSGNITHLTINAGRNVTSFDATGLSSLSYLRILQNHLTSFNGTGLSSLETLIIEDNHLTTFDATGLSSLTGLILDGNQLTSFDGAGLSSLTSLNLDGNQLTSFDGAGLSSLTSLTLDGNQFTSFDATATGLSSITKLRLADNQLTTFDATGLSSLTGLILDGNQLTSVLATDIDLSDWYAYYSTVSNNNLSEAALIAFLDSLAVTTTGYIYYGGNPGSAAFETYLASNDDKGYVWLNSLNP